MPLVGVAVFSVGVVAGQTSGSLAVDRMGISASGKRAITWQRVVASVLAVVAVAVGISDRLGIASGALGYALLAFVAGFIIAPQQAVNGRISVRARSPFSAAFVNFLGGVLMLSVFLAIALAVDERDDRGALRRPGVDVHRVACWGSRSSPRRPGSCPSSACWCSRWRRCSAS